jgi:subtilisin family serine protease
MSSTHTDGLEQFSLLRSQHNGPPATGRGVTVAVIDSGVHAEHPHVRGVAGGIQIGADGSMTADFVDCLGHGTAVTAAIKEKAPDAEIYSVKVFDRSLSTSVASLVHAIRWAGHNGIRLVNLSLGTSNVAHRSTLAAAVADARSRGVIIVSARDDGGVEWLPGSLSGVIPVQVDWACPRDTFRVAETPIGVVFRTSGFPRDIPGVPPARNLHGISFAVANMTGFVAQYLEAQPGANLEQVIHGLSIQVRGCVAGPIHGPAPRGDDQRPLRS